MRHNVSSMVFVTAKQLENADRLLALYKAGGAPPGTTDKQLWQARKGECPGIATLACTLLRLQLIAAVCALCVVACSPRWGHPP